MADILLTHANHLYSDRKQVRKMQPYPPLQTLIAAACLRRHGYETALFDATLSCSPIEGFRTSLKQHRPRLLAVCEDNFNFLTKMCLTQNRELTFSMFRAAAEAGVPAVVNSSDASDNAAAYLGAGARLVLIGELEKTILEVADSILRANGRARDQIQGLAFRDQSSGKVVRTPRRPLMNDLDWLPEPAWDLVDLKQYRDAWKTKHGRFSLNMVSSRGCPYQCNWCAKPIYGDSYHFQSAAAVASQMARLKFELGAEHCWFADDIFALSGKWTRAFADEVERLDAKLPFKMQSRCDLMTRGTVAALRSAGCEEVWMGVESGSQKILDAMDKDVTVRQVREARNHLREHGIRACYFLQFGYPGEDRQDIDQTIRLVRQTEPDDIGVSVSYPLPGTKFHDSVAAQLGSKKNWSDSDDLAMMFQGSYTSEFYKALRDALHLEVDLFNGRAAGGPIVLADAWRQVERLETECASPNPTVLKRPDRGADGSPRSTGSRGDPVRPVDPVQPADSVSDAAGRVKGMHPAVHS